MPNPTAERVQQVRDLKNQIDELRGDPDEQEIIFRETSPRRRKVTIYSMVDGEPVEITASLLERTLEKRLPNGQFMFTARKEEAPEYKLGNIPCFLHPDSPERPILREIGLGAAICYKKTLANGHSKRIHSRHRHSQEWSAFQDYLNERKEREQEERQSKQLEATLEIARGAGKSKPAPSRAVRECQSCGEEIVGKLSDHVCRE